jgi:catechol 2,3-dioxygenase-like lactoylglutathione lyase family enzyme
MKGKPMIQRFDHLTIVVTDLEKAKEFFGLFGFEEILSVPISGQRFSDYMGVDGIEARHVTLKLANASPRLEVQLLKYDHPQPLPDPDITKLYRVGFNHVCFAVDNIAEAIEKLGEAGIKARNGVLDFHDRKLVFFPGPEGITVELSEWY